MGTQDLSSLGEPISVEEVREAINQMPSDKAPGPDGFTGLFFKKCWDIIKDDIMKAITLFGNLRTANLQWLNSANVVLPPKKEGAESIADYRPISLIHAVAKIIAKVLAIRLASHMHNLVSHAQSAFIKTRSIHDNFMYVRNFARQLHKCKTPALLFKLDIRKAFDSVRWEYLLDLLQKRGFPSIFRDWVAALLRSSSSRILLNGVAGEPITHGCGLRQGDPLSPFLFVLAIDPLQKLLEVATRKGLLHKIRGRGAALRTSLYADDAVVFLAPIKSDVDNLSNILRLFGNVTGLCTNFLKSSVVPIRCGSISLPHVTQSLPAARASFPMKYLGLPLSVWQLKTVDFQFLQDKAAAKLVGWDGQNITAIGRAALVKSVLSSLAVYFITPLIVPPSTLRQLNKLQRAFLWAGTDKTTGAKCKVNWDIVCRPSEFGGLGVLNTEKFARALRLRWPWFEWKEPSKMWVGLGNPCDNKDYDLFYAFTTITVGNGARTPFWDAPWVQGRKPKDIAPLIYDATVRKNWKIREALLDNAWISKIKLSNNFSIAHFHQFLQLWSSIRGFQLQHDMEDEIVWKHTDSGHYSAASAYKAQFHGMLRSPLEQVIWKVWAPPKVKFFAWLAAQNRVWTADRLAKRGWPNCGLCPLCRREQETVDHLIFRCRFSIRLWDMIKEWLQLESIDTSVWHHFESAREWWITLSDSSVPNRKALASLALLTSWALWNERNARVFRHKSAPPFVILALIKGEAALWVAAGAKKLRSIMPGE